jgi:hypothetical protein
MNNINNISPEKIAQLINNYERDKVYRNTYYKNKYNNDPEYKIKCLENSKKNSKSYYEKNREYIKMKRAFNYYSKLNRLDDFNKKYPDYKE